MHASFFNSVRQPQLAPLLRSRSFTLAVTGLAAAHLTLSLLHLPGWQCPFHAATGLPCPGCGLTRSTSEFLHGHFADSIHTHAFGPLVPFALAAIAAAAFLPRSVGGPAFSLLEKIERRSAAVPLLLAFFLIYWIVRFIMALGQ